MRSHKAASAASVPSQAPTETNTKKNKIWRTKRTKRTNTKPPEMKWCMCSRSFFLRSSVHFTPTHRQSLSNRTTTFPMNERVWAVWEREGPRGEDICANICITHVTAFSRSYKRSNAYYGISSFLLHNLPLFYEAEMWHVWVMIIIICHLLLFTFSGKAQQKMSPEKRGIERIESQICRLGHPSSCHPVLCCSFILNEKKQSKSPEKEMVTATHGLCLCVCVKGKGKIWISTLSKYTTKRTQ